MADIRTPFDDAIVKRSGGFDIAPTLGDDPCAKIQGGPPGPAGSVTPKELPFNSLKIGTPDKGNSPYPKEY